MEQNSDDNWVGRLFEWADKQNISKKFLPRNRNKLLKKRHLNLISSAGSKGIK